MDRYINKQYDSMIARQKARQIARQADKQLGG